MLDPVGIANWSVTHVDWSEGKRHPKSYRADDINMELIQNITSITENVHTTSDEKVCPQAADVMEIYIYLGEPCHVSQLLLTISHGADDSTSPSTVDVRKGSSLDGLKLIAKVSISKKKLPYNDKASLVTSWHCYYTRLVQSYLHEKIVAGAAKGIEYLHEKTQPHVIHRILFIFL